MSKKNKVTILVAPLDWGLGHATRCIPIISELLNSGCKVIIAAEGAQEKLLKTEFPDLIYVHLPGYRIKYTNNKRFFAIKIISQLPKLFAAIRNEKKWLKDFVGQFRIDGVISDNRYGLQMAGVSCIFITHQLLIKAPMAFVERRMQALNYYFIEKFSTCWVPDEKGPMNMAGHLSHPHKFPRMEIDYLGGISRLVKNSSEIKYDFLIILSGPEPQRSKLEKKILLQFASFPGRVLLVRGLPGAEDILASSKNLSIKNHLSAQEISNAFNQSEIIISRSGYTTVMDICKMQKKSVLIPTPGQTEQEYLAHHLQQLNWCICITQEEFSLEWMYQRIEKFQYQLPFFSMDSYKPLVAEFVQKLKLNSN